jgi:hypothetical protein
MENGHIYNNMIKVFYNKKLEDDGKNTVKMTYVDPKLKSFEIKG